MLFTIYLLFVLLCFIILHLVLRYNKTARLIDRIPGPTPLPFFGNLLMFNVSLDKMWDKIIQLLDEYYPLFRIWGFKNNFIFVRHPDDMKVLLDKHNIYKSKAGLRYVDNDGLAISEGEKWRQRRKMLAPAFHQNLLELYTEITNEHAEMLIEDFQNQNIQLIPDLMRAMKLLVIKIICESTMGIDKKSFDCAKAEKFREAIDEFGDSVFYRVSRPYLQDWMMKFLSAEYKKERAREHVVRGFTKKIIQDRRNYHQKIGYRTFEKTADNIESEFKPKKRLAILDFLLSAEKDNLIDERGVLEEVEISIIAGYESSGMAISFALMLLAENKAVQDFAREEVTKLLNITGGVLAVKDINKLDYLERCIKETLRLYPSIPIASRSIKKTIKLSNYDIPPGTDAIMNFFALHRDPNFWPNPDKFDPDRFLPQNINKRHPFAYLPFGAGPRTCIGYKFAMLKVKSIVARILYNFYLEPVDSTAKVKFQMHITLKTTEPCRIKLIKINRE